MRISYSLKYLLGLFALCLMAFFGFGAVFKELGISFGIEAATAAFGTPILSIFEKVSVLLSVFFFMIDNLSFIEACLILLYFEAQFITF